MEPRALVVAVVAALVFWLVALLVWRALDAGAKCHTRACVKRVALKRLLHRQPMPYCTYGPESGGNYRAKNPYSTAGGKYQILELTWLSYGGRAWHWYYPAAYAPRLEQERVARRIAWWGWGRVRPQGLAAWVNC
jgi:hypothetical protein